VNVQEQRGFGMIADWLLPDDRYRITFFASPRQSTHPQLARNPSAVIILPFFADEFDNEHHRMVSSHVLVVQLY